VSSVLVGGLVELHIYGSNLGYSIADIMYIKLNNTLCTSINYIDMTYLRAICTHPHALHYASHYATYTIDDLVAIAMSLPLEIRTLAGVARGVSLNARDIIRSDSMRPVISSFRTSILPFMPYSVYVHDRQYVYWSNVAVGLESIMRVRVDGTQVEVLAHNVSIAPLARRMLIVAWTCLSSIIWV
jgi:hypothetical protein